MEFRLTYDGPLKAHRDDKRFTERTLHVHDIRRKFHGQLKKLWATHPTLLHYDEGPHVLTTEGPEPPSMREVFKHDGFNWLPIVTEKNGLICKLDVLMLRPGAPSEVLHDVDNRLKTLFDALRKAKGAQELGAKASRGQFAPQPDEDPFYVLLEEQLVMMLAKVR
jgi:hypothetical protein